MQHVTGHTHVADGAMLGANVVYSRLRVDRQVNREVTGKRQKSEQGSDRKVDRGVSSKVTGKLQKIDRKVSRQVTGK